MEIVQVKPTCLHEIQELACNAHAAVGQSYGGQHPYGYHLAQVAAIGERFGYELPPYTYYDTLAACWLHDIIEDCRWTYKDVLNVTTERIAEIVYSVTDEMGRDRTERKTKTYPKIAANRLGVFVKLCDRIANTEYSQASAAESSKSAHMAKGYANEYPTFRAALYAPNEYPQLWAYADKVHGW